MALTFHDGPSPRYTGKNLSVLKQHQVHGTFFVLGAHVESYPEVVRAAIQDGNEIGNHSFAHPRLTKSDELCRKQELERTALDLELLGYHPPCLLFRPPFSAYDDRLVAYLAHTNWRMVLWGIGMGAQESIMRAAIAGIVAPERRGRAYGAFNTVFGISWFLGSVLIGVLYDTSIPWLVAFSVASQLASIPIFYFIRRDI